MSNCWLNVRFWTTHVIIGERWVLGTRISKNPYHKTSKKKFKIYTLFGLHFK